MANTQVVKFEAVRTLAFGSISASYAAVGTVTLYPARLVCITNNTNGDMYFSLDGSTNMLFVAKTSFKLFDFNTNRYNSDQTFVLQTGSQFYVKQVTAPSAGDVYIEVIYGA